MREETKFAISTIVQVACSAGIPLAVYKQVAETIPAQDNALLVTCLIFLLGGMGIGAALHATWVRGPSKLVVFQRLNDREKWCLAMVMDVYPGRLSIPPEHYTKQDFDRLVDRFGILYREGKAIFPDGTVKLAYAPSTEWRGWLEKHTHKLPDPKMLP